MKSLITIKTVLVVRNHSKRIEEMRITRETATSLWHIVDYPSGPSEEKVLKSHAKVFDSFASAKDYLVTKEQKNIGSYLNLLDQSKQRLADIQALTEPVKV